MEPFARDLIFRAVSDHAIVLARTARPGEDNPKDNGFSLRILREDSMQI